MTNQDCEQNVANSADQKVKAQMEKAKKRAELDENFKSKHELKTPKGTRDFGPEQMAVRLKVLDIITDVFKRHGAVTIDTPVFELRKVLMGKYGEEGGKLVYDLDDQDGEICSLRYDLTVPFARYLAANKIEKLKRYQIAKVYRRDNPVMTKGRYREFYQCDFDIAGHGELMVQEAECLKIIDEILTKLDLGDFEIRFNHRVLLEGMFAASGISSALFKTVSSSVDKLDKQPWVEIREELIKEKGLDERAVDNLGHFVRIKDEHPGWDSAALFDWFSERKCDDGQETTMETIKTAIEELKLLTKYAELFGCSTTRAVFYPSLARGLDYYTGVIYEVVMKDFSFDPNALNNVKAAPSNAIKSKEKEGRKKKANTAQPENGQDGEESAGPLGSVAAGGRYDKLVGMFMNMGMEKGKKQHRDVPCVGISFGIERLFAIMEMKMQTEAQEKSLAIRTSNTQVLVASIKSSDAAAYVQERMKICAMLWNAGIRAETSYKANPKFLEQVQFCEHESNQIPWMVTIAETELAQNSVKLRCIATKEEKLVPLADLVPILQEKLADQK